MSEFNVSTRYARALMELAEDKSIFDRVSSDMEVVNDTLSGSRELRIMLSSPIVREGKKKEILQEIFKKYIGTETLSFLLFVIDKNREDILFGIIKRFIELRDDKIGYVNVDVISVYELPENQRETLKTNLEEYTKKKVRLKFHIDTKLVGGFIVKVGDTMLDASVSHQLERLRKTLLIEPFSIN